MLWLDQFRFINLIDRPLINSVIYPTNLALLYYSIVLIQQKSELFVSLGGYNESLNIPDDDLVRINWCIFFSRN